MLCACKTCMNSEVEISRLKREFRSVKFGESNMLYMCEVWSEKCWKLKCNLCEAWSASNVYDVDAWSLMGELQIRYLNYEMSGVNWELYKLYMRVEEWDLIVNYAVSGVNCMCKLYAIYVWSVNYIYSMKIVAWNVTCDSCSKCGTINLVWNVIESIGFLNKVTFLKI